MKTELHEGSRNTNSGKAQPHPCMHDSPLLCRIHPYHSARVAHRGFACPVPQVCAWMLLCWLTAG